MRAKLKRWLGGRLSRQFMMALTVSVILVGAPAGLLLFHFSERWAIEDASRITRFMQDAKVQQIESDLQDAERSLGRLERFIQAEMLTPAGATDDSTFAARFVTYPDGAYRSDPKRFDGRTHAGAYIEPGAASSPFRRALHARITRLLDVYGAARPPHFDSLWLLTRWQSAIMLMPRVPAFIYNANAQFDISASPSIRGADPARNPTRALFWTRPVFDPISRSWMISAVKPLDLEGTWVGSIGHDFLLAGLFERISEDSSFDQAQNFLIDAHGEYMLAGAWQHRIESADFSAADKRDIDLALASVRADLARAGTDRVVTTSFLDTPHIAAVSTINGPNWQLLHLVPIKSVEGRLSQAFLGSAVVTLLAFMLVALAIHALLQQRVITPLHALAGSVQRFESGELDSRAEVRTRDEIGRLATAFNSMVARISLSQRKLEATQVELQNRNIELQRANRVKSNFLANMSHELRTPLNAILGFSEVLDLELYGPVGDRRYLEYVGHIHRSGQHLLELINDVLDLSKIEAEKMDLQFSLQDIRPLIEDCLTMVRPSADEHQLTLLAPSPGPAVLLNCDRRAFNQMLINLLSNAVRHTPAGGTVAVLIESRPDGALVVGVQDEGSGIPDKLLPHLFSPFGVRSAHISGASGRGGTGLGLSITQGLIRLHGGEILVETAIGVGTTMRLAFPATRRPSAIEAPPALDLALQAK
ncbi:MAG: sensor histidine kinase [Rhodospirillaceae bacterium]|nr:sensor histidine kinase [Rhodospirillaceae bacterium]